MIDYNVTGGKTELTVECYQKKAREQVIKQYIDCRKRQRMTQTELAKRAGMARSNVTRFESGNYNPSLELMARIAAALNMEIRFELKEGSAG